MNIEEIVFNGITELYLNTDVDDDNDFQIKVSMNLVHEKYNKYSELYLRLLDKKFDEDYFKMSLYIVKKFLKCNNIISVKNNITNISGVTLNSLEIILNKDKKVYINVPISYTEDYDNSIDKFLNSISYYNIKKKSIEKVYESAFDYYTNRPVDNLVVFDSNFSTNVVYFMENKKNNNKSLYVFSNKTDDKDVLMMIIEDFINKNKKLVDKMNKEKDKKAIISFSNGKTLEISDKVVLEKMNNNIDNLTNELIDKKIKKLRLNNKKSL